MSARGAMVRRGQDASVVFRLARAAGGLARDSQTEANHPVCYVMTVRRPLKDVRDECENQSVD